MITEKPHNVNWNFYIALEKDLENISRYIELKPNLGTYSIELSRLLFAASSEVDVVAKQLCKILNPSSNPDNIKKYGKVILKSYPNFINETIYIERYGLEYKPWLNWSSTQSPDWWQSYNNVKHERDEYFYEANLQNAINSLGALLNYLYFMEYLSFGINLTQVLIMS